MSTPDIYIPTYKRDHLRTLESMAGSKSLERVSLVVHPDEVERYEPLGLHITPCPAQGELGAVRRWLMENHQGDYMVQMDDDLRFAVRRTDEPTKFVKSGPDDIDEMFARVFALLQVTPLVGVQQRGGANYSPPPLEIAARQCMLHGLDVRTAKEEGWVYKSSVFEDFDYTLQALTSGYGNVVLTTHTIDQRESNAPGGVADYRDRARMQRDAVDLALDFPGFVKVMEKKGWRGMPTRTDVRVQWKKALSSSAAPRHLDVDLYSDLWWPN